jgi:hypothetical protein
MTSHMMHKHLLTFGSVMFGAWALGTFLFVYFWPHIVYNHFERAIVDKGFGDGPIPVNTLYTEPQTLFADSPPRARLGLKSDDYWREPRHAPYGRLVRPQ